MAGTMIDSIIMKIGADITSVQTAYASMRGLTQQSASTFDNLKTATSNLGSAAKNTWNVMGNNPLSAVMSGAKNAGNAILDFGKNVAQPVFFMKDMIQTGAGLVTSLFSQNAAMEQTKIAFTGLMGSGQKAQDMLNKLESFAAATPFEFPELAQDARLLMAMGFEANQVIPIMRNVGDTVAGLGGGSEMIQRIVYSMGQMKSAGRVTGEEMRELALAGIPAWQWLAKAVGTDVPTAMKMAQSGAIDVNTALNALQTGMKDKFGGQMANQARTFNGLLSTMKDNIGMALRAFLGPAFESAKGGLMQLTDLLGSPKVKEFATQMGVVLGAALKNLAAMLMTVVPKIVDFVNWLRQGSVPAQALIVAVLAIAAAFAAFKVYTFVMALVALGTAMWGAAVAAWGFTVALLANPITWIVIAIVAAVALIILVVRNWGAISQWLVGVWNAVKGFFIGFWNGIVAAWNAAISGLSAWLRGVWNGIVAFLTAVWNGIKGVAMTVFAAIVAAILGPFLPLIVWFATHWAQISAILRGVWVLIQIVARQLWLQIQNAISGPMNAVRTVISVVWAAISGFLSGIWNAIRGVATTVWNAITSTISNFLQMELRGAQIVWGAISSFLSGIWNAIRGVASAVWNAITSVISSAISTAQGIITSIWNSISGVVTGIWNGIMNTAASIWNAITSRVSGAINQILGIAQSIGGSILDALTWPFRAAYDAISGTIGSIIGKVQEGLGWLAKLGGGGAPGAQSGVTNFAGGPMWVGEGGKELLWLPKGASISDHSDSMNIANSKGNTTFVPTGASTPGVVNVFLQIDGRTLIQALGQGFADEIRIQVGGAH